MYDSHVILSYYYRIPVDRDYNKMTEQDCSQVVTHYGGKEFGSPWDVAITPNEEVVIVDYGNNCIVVLDHKLKLLTVIGQGSGNNRLVNPDSVAVTDSIVAVSEWCGHQVKKYSLQGELLSVIGCHGNKNGQFDHPTGLAFNKNKLLYVVDRDNYRVQVFQQDDKFSFSFGSRGSNPGQFWHPVGIAIDHNNNVIVTDYGANHIVIFTQSGEFIQTINSYRPCNIAISPTGYLITDHDGRNNKIRIWSPIYQCINKFGKLGSKQGELYGIRGMAIGSNGTLYVVESINKRLQVISNSKFLY